MLVLLAPSFCLWVHIHVVGLEYVQHMQSEWRVINFNVSLSILANGVEVLIVFVTVLHFIRYILCLLHLSCSFLHCKEKHRYEDGWKRLKHVVLPHLYIIVRAVTEIYTVKVFLLIYFIQKLSMYQQFQLQFQ